MGGSIVLDTNAVIAFRAGDTQITTLCIEAEHLYLPVNVLGELLYGANNSARVDENKEAVLQFLSHCTLIPNDEATAYIYSEIRTTLKRLGKPIPENDLWIASSALQLQLPLVSNDKHFDNISKLEVIRWGGK